MSHFKSLVSTSLFMSLCFLPNLASAGNTNSQGPTTNNYQGWQHANDDQVDEQEDKNVNGDQSPYASQAAYNSSYATQGNQSWKDKWDRHYGSTANNTHYYSSTPNHSTNPNYDNVHSDYEGVNSNYVSTPTHYNSNGYPAYQSYPADGYYYNAGYSNSSPTQYNANGYPSYNAYPADGYYYNTNNSNSYPYSQDYNGSGVGPGVYFNVR